MPGIASKVAKNRQMVRTLVRTLPRYVPKRATGLKELPGIVKVLYDIRWQQSAFVVF